MRGLDYKIVAPNAAMAGITLGRLSISARACNISYPMSEAPLSTSTWSNALPAANIRNIPLSVSGRASVPAFSKRHSRDQASHLTSARRAKLINLRYKLGRTTERTIALLISPSFARQIPAATPFSSIDSPQTTQANMAGTRSSTRKADKSSSPAKSDDAVAGSKRKPDAQPSPARSRKATKKQATLEESGITNEDSEMKDASDQEGGKQSEPEAKTEQQDVKSDENDAMGDASNGDAKEDMTTTATKADTTNDDATKKDDDSAAKVDTTNDDAIEKSSQREKDMPSNILEKGLIYFFTRNRVGIDDADSVGDLQRTFFVLRPLPTGAKLGDGAIPDLKNNRLFALPKKTFPKSHNDRFMAFVEKANTSIQDLKDNFFKGSSYETKTQGTRQVDPVNPVAEGVYAITRTEDRTTHLIYSTTIPSDLGEIQEDLGIKDQGSFIVSVKNPERSGPAAASLPQKPDFSKEYVTSMSWS